MADRLARAFRFKVTLLRSPTAASGGRERQRAQPAGGAVRLSDGAFQECSGLEIEQDIQEYLEGGRNFGVIKRVGRARFQNLTLRRGMFFPDTGGGVNRDLWEWMQGVLAGVRPVARYDGVVDVYDVAENVVARWEFDRGLPARLRGPELNARTGEVAIEELQIAHEGLRLVAL